MHKKALICTGVLILAALAWAANEPWKTKAYPQWDTADLELILSNSPWAKKIVVEVDWKPAASSGGQAAAPSTDTTLEARQHMEVSKGGPPDTSPPPASMSSVGSGGDASTSAHTAFYIRWYSSRVIREALVREAILNGKMSEAEGAKFLAVPIRDYEIIVFGPDMTPFQNITDDELKSASYLEGKQSKQKVATALVRASKSPDGRTNSVTFIFPKKADGGADVASPQEKGLEFVCKLKGLALHNTFDTHKMVDQNGIDF